MLQRTELSSWPTQNDAHARAKYMGPTDKTELISSGPPTWYTTYEKSAALIKVFIGIFRTASGTTFLCAAVCRQHPLKGGEYILVEFAYISAGKTIWRTRASDQAFLGSWPDESPHSLGHSIELISRLITKIFVPDADHSPLGNGRNFGFHPFRHLDHLVRYGPQSVLWTVNGVLMCPEAPTDRGVSVNGDTCLV